MLGQIYDIKLNHSVSPNTVAVGWFDGVHPSLLGATSGNRVFVHSAAPKSAKSAAVDAGKKQLDPSQGEISFFNMKQTINAVATGQLVSTSKAYTLAVATSSSLLAYNVERNADLFYKDLPDGVSSVCIGSMGKPDSVPLVICGGNCTIQGFDANGQERFWTMTGDNVTSLALHDFNKDGEIELAVGSEDFNIRFFRGDELVVELAETDVVTCLCSLAPGRLAFALKNGIVGIYEGTTRSWRIKSNCPATSLLAFDINDDGVNEIVIGWSSGKIECRSDASRDGEPVYKESMPSAIAGIIKADYRMDGDEHVIAVSVDGHIRGFSKAKAKASTSAPTMMQKITDTQEDYRKMSQYKQRLLLELGSYERNEEIEEKVFQGEGAAPADSIPANTQLVVRISVEPGSLLLKSTYADEAPAVKLSAVVNVDTVQIRALAVFAEGVFESGESQVLHPPANRPLGNQLALPIVPFRDAQAELHVTAIVGQRHSSVFHVLEATIELPKFAMYVPHDSATFGPLAEARGRTFFLLRERIERVVLWVNQAFLLPQDLYYTGSSAFHIGFIAIRTGEPVVLHMEPNGATMLGCGDISLAGDIINSLAGFLGLQDLQVKAEFPAIEAELQELSEKIVDLRKNSDRLAGDIAEQSEMVRLAVVRLEDSRLLGDLTSFRRSLIDLQSCNRSILNQHRFRSDGHQQLVGHLRRLNQIIQAAASLRVGKPKTDLVSACREAIKTNNLKHISNLVRAG